MRDKKLHGEAVQVVSELLELERENANFRAICSNCEQEYGQVPVPDNVAKSHTVCKRHFAEMYREMGAVPDETRGSSSYAPDMASLTPEQRQDYRVATADRGWALRTKPLSRQVAGPGAGPDPIFGH